MLGLWVEVVDCVAGDVADALEAPAIYYKI
jgi:hypothetical protein